MTREDTLKPLGGQCSKCLKQKVQCICHTMFKVGDWVRNNDNEIFQLDDLHMWQKDLDSLVKLWQPKEGEWCWFYSPFWTDKKPILDTFKCTEENKFRTGSDVQTTHCEPFIGELPSFIKDKQ